MWSEELVDFQGSFSKEFSGIELNVKKAYEIHLEENS